jgi:hypothetical protein
MILTDNNMAPVSERYSDCSKLCSKKDLYDTLNRNLSSAFLPARVRKKITRKDEADLALQSDILTTLF